MKTKILIFGVSGMLGHTLFTELSKNLQFDIKGVVRNLDSIKKLPKSICKNNIYLADVQDIGSVEKAIARSEPDVIINAVGIIKQRPEAGDFVTSFPINSLWPHQLAALAKKTDAYLIQISTDCVFNGEKGNYSEEDTPNPEDPYGKTKWIGELNYPKVLTIRTSLIGHELETKISLVGWFLSQKKQVNGYVRAIFSGLPTVEMARIIEKYIIPNINSLEGLFHVSASPINKYTLLTMVAHTYRKNIMIKKRLLPKVNRSLNSTKFKQLTGYKPPSWDKLVKNMYNHYYQSSWYEK